MATVKAPLLSLDARGQIGKALVYMGWKGLKTVRQHVTPANPNTAAQQTQRTLLTDMVSAWKNYFTDSESREAWNRWALDNSKPLSGFNGFGSQVIPITSSDPDASFANGMTETAANKVTFAMLNADAGDTGDETGDFEIWAGSTISGMTLQEAVAIVAGDIVGTTDLGDAGDIVYCKVRLLGKDRSGIYRATIID